MIIMFLQGLLLLNHWLNWFIVIFLLVRICFLLLLSLFGGLLSYCRLRFRLLRFHWFVFCWTWNLIFKVILVIIDVIIVLFFIVHLFLFYLLQIVWWFLLYLLQALIALCSLWSCPFTALSRLYSLNLGTQIISS